MTSTVFTNVQVFDSRTGTLSELGSVAVTNGRITKVLVPMGAKGLIIEDALDDDVVIVDGHGRVLLPGLIDAHAHVAFATLTAQQAIMSDPTYLGIRGAVAARDMLLRGFTTVRDAGGPVFGIRQAIDQGLTDGPRIYPSGAFISQTSGHGDFRFPFETPRGACAHLSHTELMSAAVIADGVPEVLRGVREQLLHGASQIKVMAGGGVSSAYDPIDVTEYTEDEIRAAVDAASNWGTYVMVHAYTARAVQQAIRAGVRCIEHGQLLDDETAKMMAEHGVWWSLQPFLDDEDAIPMPNASARAKQLEVTDGTDRAFALAKQYGINVAWGTDTLFDAKLATRQGAQLAKMVRWYAPTEVLQMATIRNAELLALSGPRNPYPAPLGVIEEGAYADLLLVNGNPLENIGLIADPENLQVIMKDGKILKNTLAD